MTIKRGVSFILTITVRDANEDPIDLTGATARAEVRSRAAKAATLILDLAPTISDATGGVISINVPPAQTADLEPGVGKWDLLLDMPGGDTLEVIPTEDITIAATATEPA